MIDKLQIEDMLGRWGSHTARGNIERNLRVKISSYAERIGSGGYKDHYVDLPDDDIAFLDKQIQMMELPDREVLYAHYVDPRPVKAKNKYSKTETYYAVLNHTKQSLMARVNRVMSEQ